MKYFLTRLHILLLALVVGLLAASSAFGTATIIILNNDKPGVGFNDPSPPVAGATGNNGATLGEQRMIAFQAAANIWGATLVSGPTITISASWPSGAADDPDVSNRALPCTQGSATLASAGNSGNIWKDFPGSVPGFWYGNALANALNTTNTDMNGGGTPEINARFNVNLGTQGCFQGGPWYYGLDNLHGSKTDMITVALHEFAHGLGFQTFTSSTTGAQAFGFPTIYDRFLFDVTANKTWAQMTTDLERKNSAINAGFLVWNGPQVTGDAGFLNDGKDSQGRPLMFAPSTVSTGSSVSHWDTSPIPNQLMEPQNNGNLGHGVTVAGNPPDLTFSLLRDIGWCAGCPQPPPPSPTPTPSPPPNDNFVNAQVISGCSGSVTGTNVASTHEAGEPTHFPGVGNRSVWYRWVAPSTSNAVTITTAGSSFDTILAVYTGSSVNGLTLVPNGNNDDIPDVNGVHDVTSSVTINVTAGQTYQIVVDGFNNGDGGGTGSIKLNWTASSCTQGATVRLTASDFPIAENSSNGFVTVSVIREGTSAGAATVNFVTSDTSSLNAACSQVTGKASERCDYATILGTLSWASGELGTKTFNIPIINDAHVEGTETFNVTLSNPTGVTLGTQSATVTIADNDSNPPGPNPIDGVDFFITQLYIDFLGRMPDAGGFQNWHDTLAPCPNGGFGEPQTSNCDRLHVAGGFFQSDEFLNRGYWAFRLYMVSYNLRPTYAQFIPDMAQVGGQKSPAEEDAAKAAFANAFVLQSSFTTKYPGLSGQALANALLQTSGLPAGSYNAGAQTNGQILRGIAETSAAFNKFLTEGTVSIQYFAFLRRDPDTVGYNNNVATLNANPSNLRHMIFIFIYSNEYRGRFGP